MQINFIEIIEEHLGGRRAAIHDDEIGFFQRAESWRPGRADGTNPKTRRRHESVSTWNFRCRSHRRRELDVFVLEVLDEVDGKETFADTALAIED